MDLPGPLNPFAFRYSIVRVRAICGLDTMTTLMRLDCGELHGDLSMFEDGADGLSKARHQVVAACDRRVERDARFAYCEIRRCRHDSGRFDQTSVDLGNATGAAKTIHPEPHDP